MVGEPNERDAWVADAQRWIGQIKGVKQCRINLDDQGEVEEILVVAGSDKEPRKIVRDVETLLKARLDLDVYYKKISVAQLTDNRPEFAAGTDPGADPLAIGAAGSLASHHDTRNFFADQPLDAEPLDDGPVAPRVEPPRPAAAVRPAPASAVAERPAPAIPAVVLAEEVAPRIICTNVGVMASDMLVRAEVQLKAGDIEALGTVEGPNHADSDLTLVARATVEAIAQLLVDPVLLHLKEVRLENLGGQFVVLTAIDLVEGRQSDTLFGTCSTRHNRQQAVVYSVLNALNRRLSLFALKTSRARG